MKLVDILNTEFNRPQILQLMKNKTVVFEQSTFLEVDSFKLRPYQNSTDILGIGSNDDHYIGTIAGLGLKTLQKLIS